ncbi:hypothetical protein H4Q26_013039 [Puccinia striiformis f. sp. tritici PST-130]|nr:hypothetical protein H4Q26_013039 [Puccinia striiformis f. sp. tritici PST-130]
MGAGLTSSLGCQQLDSRTPRSTIRRSRALESGWTLDRSSCLQIDEYKKVLRSWFLPSSSHSISYFAIQPSQSSIITSLSTLLPSNTMSSSADQSYYSPYAPSSTDYRSPPTHSLQSSTSCPRHERQWGRPALRSTCAVANAPVVGPRNGPNRRPALARHNNRRGPARGNRRAPAVSPAISAVCGKNSGGLRSNHYVLTPRRNEPTFYRTPYQTHTDVVIINHHLPRPGHTSKGGNDAAAEPGPEPEAQPAPRF